MTVLTRRAGMGGLVFAAWQASMLFAVQAGAAQAGQTPPASAGREVSELASNGLAAEFRERGDVPAGVVTKKRMPDSDAYPGFSHDYWIYEPAQYRGDQPACLMVFLDGETALDADAPIPTVLDNMIAAKHIPVMIGLFLDPGRPALNAKGGPGPDDNRSMEYNSIDSRFSGLLVDELMPEVARSYNISSDPACRAIAGASSGAVAAFGTAWHRPEAFGKVFSYIGSFVNIRGADAFPSMIRRADKKPIRVLLRAGEGDLDNVYGNWPLANKQMAAALAFKAYDYRFQLGPGGHDALDLRAEFANDMRWLWREGGVGK